MKAMFNPPRLPVELVHKGKVRNVYRVGDLLMLVATDRISAFDHVLPTPVPWKGRVLNQLSAFWFRKTRHLVRNHLVSTDPSDLPETLKPFAEELQGRFMLVRPASMLPVECVVRGYLAGSGFKEYQRKGTISGVVLPSGLGQWDRLPEPVFTPTTKAAPGTHDEPIDFDRVVELLGGDLASRLRQVSVELYRFASAYAAERGVIIADTKFEFGRVDGELVLCDELFTPDSSRLWDAACYRPGEPQEQFDKQFVRDYLDRIGWDRSPPAPELPEEVVKGTTERYLAVFERLTGRKPH